MKKALALALIAAVAAAGCSSDASKAARLKNPAPCPPVIVLKDAARMVEFAGEQRLEDVAYSAEVVKAESLCRYFDDRPIEASVKLRFAFGKGPKADADKKDFAYFVAVTRKDAEVIEKSEFVLPVSWGGGESISIVTDEIDEILIPRASKDISGTNFEIVVGMVLTPQQAIFNRSGKSLKFPDAQ
jgi:ABC-type Fe3+-hydroxamate transport system substrate-binding protein